MIEIFTLPIYVWISLGFLIMLSIIDVITYKRKDGAIPSLLTTTFILVVFLSVGYPINIYLGVLALIMSFALSDLGMFYGVADFKILIAIGMTVNKPISFISLILVLTVVSLIYKFIFKKITKQNELPFIPAILITYIIGIVLSLLMKRFI